MDSTSRDGKTLLRSENALEISVSEYLQLNNMKQINYMLNKVYLSEAIMCFK